MGILLTAVLALVLAIPGAATGAQTAERGDDCVTRAEYRQARHGMLKARVHRMFGTSGRLVYLVVDNEEKRAYPMCDPSRRLTVTYLDGRLAYKDLRG